MRFLRLLLDEVDLNRAVLTVFENNYIGAFGKKPDFINMHCFH